MATNQEFVQALRKAAEAIAGRTLTQDEQNRLVELFNAAKGTNYERAQEAVRKFCNLTQIQLLEKTAASDNTDRIVNELEKITKEWKPGT